MGKNQDGKKLERERTGDAEGRHLLTVNSFIWRTARIRAPDDRISTRDASNCLFRLFPSRKSVSGYLWLLHLVQKKCDDTVLIACTHVRAKNTLQGLHNILTTKLDFQQSDFATLRLVYNLCFHTRLPPESSQPSLNVTTFIHGVFDYYSISNLNKLWLLQFLKL